MRSFIANNVFLLLLIGAALLAWLHPPLGAYGGPLRPALLIPGGVFLLFFLQGVALPSETLVEDLANWRVHLYCQSWNFLLFPALVVGLAWVLPEDLLAADLRLGFLYLAALPSTLSSSVIFASLLGGNRAAALLNASLSNMLGIFIVPLWTRFLLSAADVAAPPVLPLLVKVLCLLLLPFVLGQLLRPRLSGWAARRKVGLRWFSHGVILFIVYVAFCDSFAKGVWREVAAGQLALVIVCTLLLLALASGLVWLGTGTLRFRWENRISAFFCGSQKTLAAGLPMAASIFEGVEGVELSVVVLPLILYHMLQLLFAGLVYSRFQKRRKP